MVPLDLIPLAEALLDSRSLNDGTWDIAFINSDWIASACERGRLKDLREFIRSDAPEDYPQGWTDSMLRLQQRDGVIAGLPYHDGPECLIYRKDLFEDAAEQVAYQRSFGIPLKPPATWQEFRQIARFFQRPSAGLYGCAFAAYPDGHNTVYDFLLQLWTRGGTLQDENGNFRFDTPQAREALDFYREMLADSSLIHPKSEQLDSIQCGDAFARGEAAMSVNWFGFAAVAEAAANSQVRGKVGIAPIPCQPPHRSASLNVYWILAMAAGSRNPELSYEFMRHCVSKEMDRLLTLEGGIGCRRSTWEDVEVNQKISFYRQLGALHANAREIPSLTIWPEVNHVIDVMVLEARSGGRSTPDLLREADQRVACIGRIGKGL
jgi:multiple sugar transport system substrate-binding protein